MAEKVTSSSPPEDKESSPCQLQGMENKSNVMIVYSRVSTCHFLPTGRRLSDGTQGRRSARRSFVSILSSDIIHHIITMPCSSTHIA